MRHPITSLIVLSVLALMTACRPPETHTTTEKVFSSCYVTYYGHCYDSLPNVSVLMLDFYTSGLTLDSTGHMQGSGQNLCLTDVFVPDSLLESGDYVAGYSGDVFTFLSGQNHDGMPHGTYLLDRVEGMGYTTQVFDSAQFTVTKSADDIYDIRFVGYIQRQLYRATFTGPLLHLEK